MRLTALILISVTLFQFCENGDSTSVKRKDLKEPLIRENIKITKEEQRLIDRYVERRNWTMEETGTGLRYMIYEHGSGMQAEADMKATVEYEITLLNGTLCYSSEEKGPRTFNVGRDNVEAGIHEGVQLLHVGDRAKFIVPAYLGHGLSGDNNKIPPQSTLVVDIHLIRLN